MACDKGTLVLFGRMKELLFSVGLEEEEEESGDKIFPEMAEARLFPEGFSPAAPSERYGSVDKDAVGWAMGETLENVALLAVSLTGRLF